MTATEGEKDRRGERMNRRASDDRELWALLVNANDTMERIHRDIDEQNLAGLQRRRFTNLVIRFISIFLMVLVVINLYLLSPLDQRMRAIVTNMGDMTGHFAVVATEMVSVEGSTQRMGKMMDFMPAISGRMEGINREVEGIGGHMAGIDREMEKTLTLFAGIDRQMAEVNGRVYTLNGSVAGIRHDMNRISQPSRWMNNFLP
ncbi:MAG: hypothetical protein HQL48_04295 [Gammaproteobacteria bacterium]|nr:hypothetical protein [Gammaproteobacteria bacterium]